MRDFTRAELLALTPERYLAGGYHDAAGQIRRELRGEYATAAATQLLTAQVSAHEFSLTIEAILQVLPLHDEPAADQRLAAALEEALLVVARAIQQDNNEDLVDWLIICATAVTDRADLAAFLTHVQVVSRQYSILAALQLPDSPSSSLH